MEVQKAYNAWAAQYDTNENKTRDLEAIALRAILKGISFNACLEIGCGTGKNTAWLLTKAEHVTAVDLSDEMLAKAQAKINTEKVQFHQADIMQEGSLQTDLLIWQHSVWCWSILKTSMPFFKSLLKP